MRTQLQIEPQPIRYSRTLDSLMMEDVSAVVAHNAVVSEDVVADTAVVETSGTHLRNRRKKQIRGKLWRNLNGVIAIAALLQVCVFLKHWEEGKFVPASELARKVRLHMSKYQLEQTLGQPSKLHVVRPPHETIYEYQRSDGTLRITLRGNKYGFNPFVQGWRVDKARQP